MIFDILVVAAVVILGVIIFNSMISGASVGKGAAAIHAERQVEKPKKPSAPKNRMSKKEVARLRAEEAALDALVAKESRSVSGMTTDKDEVITLEKVREQAKQSKPAAQGKQGPSSPAGSPVAAVPTLTPQQKVAEQAHGFKVVDSSDEILARRKAKATSQAVAPVTVSKRELLDKKLGLFFRSKKGGDKKKPAATAPAVAEAPVARHAEHEAAGRAIPMPRSAGGDRKATGENLRAHWDGRREWTA